MTEYYQTFWISRRIFWVQGLYYALTGLWPLVDLSSFQAVTGANKAPWLVHDLWLVQTVGAILFIVGLGLCTAGWQIALQIPSYVLAAGSALTLLLVDVIFTARGTISAVYLLDALAECFFLIAWGTLAFLAFRDHHNGRRRQLHHLALALR